MSKINFIDMGTEFTHEGKVDLGDRVRCYDFPPMPDRPDSYVEGVVTGVGVETLTVVVDTDTMFPDKPRPEIRTPYRTLSLEWEGRITKLEGKADG